MTTDKIAQASAVLPIDSCPGYHAAIELIGRRWNGVILRRLAGGAARFSELRGSIPGITDTMLAQRLRELEDAAVVSRQVVGSRPVAISYGLTEIGAQLSPILDAVALWSDRWADGSGSEPGASRADRDSA